MTQRDGAVYLSGRESDIKSSRRKPNFACAAPQQESKVVVVGGGSGAVGVVEGLRERGYKGAITVISNEGYLPVDRPKLSKALIGDPAKLAWRDKAWYDSGSVDWVEGEVTEVDFEGKAVTTKEGESISYTKLVLATGGTARQLSFQGFRVLGNIFTLRTVHDTKKIVDAIGDKNKKIVVIGSSFIGMEMAAASSANNDVTVVGRDGVPLERVLGQSIGSGIQKTLEAKGVKFLKGGVDKAEPSSADPSKVGAVILKDGTRLEADLVVLGVGVTPATEYLKNNKSLMLEKDGSLKVDENYAVLGLQDVYAVGDISTFPYHGPGGNGRHTRIEHWNVAQQSGRVAATHIVDPSVTSERYIPVFWSALGSQLRYCGNTAGGFDDLVLDGNPAEGSFLAYYTKGEIVVAMASMGRDPAMVQSLELMRTGSMPTKTQLQQTPDVMTWGIPA